MRRRWLIVIALAVVWLCVWISAPFWLTGIGNLLVSSEPPRQADAALVLAGDYRGQRLLTACELLRQGLVSTVLVSGPMDWYGTNEADAAIAFGASNGCDTSRLKPVYVKAFSTVDEVRAIRPILQQMGIRDLLIITSNYHTARASRTFRRELGGVARFTMVASPDEFFAPDRWWKTREGQKTVFYEVSKTIANWVGL